LSVDFVTCAPIRQITMSVFSAGAAISAVAVAFSPQARSWLVHDPEKWEPVFGKDHAQSKS